MAIPVDLPKRKGLLTGQVLVGTFPTLLLASDHNRSFLEVKNLDANQNLYVGDETVDVPNGYPLLPGTAFTADTTVYTGDLYGVVAAGSVAAAVIEW